MFLRLLEDLPTGYRGSQNVWDMHTEIDFNYLPFFFALTRHRVIAGLGVVRHRAGDKIVETYFGPKCILTRICSRLEI